MLQGRIGLGRYLFLLMLASEPSSVYEEHEEVIFFHSVSLKQIIQSHMAYQDLKGRGICLLNIGLIKTNFKGIWFRNLIFMHCNQTPKMTKKNQRNQLATITLPSLVWARNSMHHKGSNMNHQFLTSLTDYFWNHFYRKLIDWVLKLAGLINISIEFINFSCGCISIFL